MYNSLPAIKVVFSQCRICECLHNTISTQTCTVRVHVYNHVMYVYTLMQDYLLHESMVFVHVYDAVDKNTDTCTRIYDG